MMRLSISTFTVCLIVLPAYAKYGGGSGTAQDPYQIATAADLIALAETPGDYGKSFLLTADIDLDPKLAGRKVFDKAVIAPDTDSVKSYFQGTPFSGVFDGNGHAISHLTITGKDYLGLFGQLASGAKVRDLGVVDVMIAGTGDEIGGIVGYNDRGDLTRCYSTGAVGGKNSVGGLLGENMYGTVTNCYSTGAVSGDDHVGGLVGRNDGTVTQCYSTGTVAGQYSVGGLVGRNGRDDAGGTVTHCYSTASVRGGGYVGGLVGFRGRNSTVTQSYSAGAVGGQTGVGGLAGSGIGSVTACFWDILTSGQTASAGGTSKTTAEMQTAGTFLNAGWDFVGETANGTGDIWWILEGKDYPRLTWERGGVRRAFAPYPSDGATDVVRSRVLRWAPGEPLLRHDVYLGCNEEVIANATTAALEVYRGRYAPEVTTYDPAGLEWSKTYYWRIDEVNEGDPNSPWRGTVWSFTTIDFVVVNILDDFESYTDEGNQMFRTWKDGVYEDASNPGNGTGSVVGNMTFPVAEQMIVHGGKQSMPMDYNNVKKQWYSEAQRTWATSQDWTIGGADTLTLYFRGKADNGLNPLYVGIEDGAGHIAIVVHPDAEAVLVTEWQKWHIALAAVRAVGVDVAAVKKMLIGVGDRKNPKPGGTGTIYIDDIRLTKRMP